MKKVYTLKVLTLLLFVTISFRMNAAEPPYLQPIADQTAMLGELFTLDVDAINADPAETYELVLARPGMTINPSTGVISWTPAEPGDGGVVTVKAYNTEGESQRSFLVYISDAIVCSDDLTSYWKLDEESGNNLLEDYQGGYNATSLTPLTDTEGMVDRGKLFTPVGKTDQFAYVEDNGQYDFQRSGGFSISLWFNYQGQYTGSPTNQVLIGRGSFSDVYETMLMLLMINVEDDPGRPRISFNLRPNSAEALKSATPNINISTNQWYHVVAIYDGPTNPTDPPYLRVYINNVVTSYSHFFGQYDFTGEGLYDLNIGYWDRYETNRYSFNGAMDEILIYNKALSAAEVSEIYNDGLQGRPHCKPGNYYPIVTSVPVETARQGELYTYTITADDYDGGDLVFSEGDQMPDWLTFDPATGILTGTPGGEDVGDHPVSLIVSDGITDITQEFTITVQDVNDPPIFTSVPDTTATEGQAYTYVVTATDPEGDDLTFSAALIPDWLSFNENTHILVGIPARENTGENSVILMVSDGEFDVAQEFVIDVESDNNLPVFTSTPVIQVDNLADYEYTVSAFDADASDVLTYRADLLPDWLSFDSETLVLSGTPSKQDVGDHDVILVVSDGYDDVTQEFTVNVRDVNTAPEIVSTPKESVAVDKLYTYLIVVVDYEGDNITATPTVVPDWMTFDAGSMVLSGTPSIDELGDHNVVITISDGVFTVNHSFSVTVTRWPVGIEEKNAIVSKVYPNPAEEIVNFELKTKMASTIEILDVSGKVVKLMKVNAGEHAVVLDISDLKHGLYMFRVYNDVQSEEGKLIIK